MNYLNRRAVILPLLLLMLSFAAFSQDDKSASKDELFNKIAKSSQSKKPEEQAKGYELGKSYLAKYGQENDDNAKKVKKFVDGYRLNIFNKALDENRMADAIAASQEMLAANPNDSYVTMNLAYGGFEAFNKKQDKSFAADSVKNAQQTLASFDAGTNSSNLAPFKSKDEAVSMMHYVIGFFSADTDPKLAAGEYYKSIQLESPVKKSSGPYYSIASYYEKAYVKAADDYRTKYAERTTEDNEMKAAQAKIEKILDLMLDAYVRAIKVAEGEPASAQSRAGWQTRLTDVYKFRFKKEDGLAEFSQKVLASPFPDPSNL